MKRDFTAEEAEAAGGELDRVESALTQLEDMMKKTVKKLVLAKETVRNLDLGLGQILGGIETYEYPCTYNYASRQKCAPTRVNSECVCAA